MKYTFKGLDGTTNEETLVEVILTKSLLLHATPRDRSQNILKEGLLIGMPTTKSIIPQEAIFLTEVSDSPCTNDLFRYYNDWCVIVVDTSKIPNHKFYRDFFAQPNMDNIGKENKHVMCFENIPAKAIKKIAELN